MDTTHHLPTFLSAPAPPRLPDEGSPRLGKEGAWINPSESGGVQDGDTLVPEPFPVLSSWAPGSLCSPPGRLLSELPPPSPWPQPVAPRLPEELPVLGTDHEPHYSPARATTLGTRPRSWGRTAVSYMSSRRCGDPVRLGRSWEQVRALVAGQSEAVQ